MAWTNDKIKQLETMVRNKLSLKEIANNMGLNRNQVAGKCHRLGLRIQSGMATGRKPADKDCGIVMKMIRKHTDDYGWGLEFEEIVEYTGLNVGLVVVAVRKLLLDRKLNKCNSNVADHTFYNNNGIKQIGVPT